MPVDLKRTGRNVCSPGMARHGVLVLGLCGLTAACGGQKSSRTFDASPLQPEAFTADASASTDVPDTTPLLPELPPDDVADTALAPPGVPPLQA